MEVYCAEFVEDERGVGWCVFGESDGVVRVWDLRRGVVELGRSPHGGDITDIQAHPTEPAIFVTASIDACLKIWNAKTCAMVAKVQSMERCGGGWLSCRWLPTGTHLLASGTDGLLALFSINKTTNTAYRAALEYSYTGQPASFTVSVDPRGKGKGRAGAAVKTSKVAVPIISDVVDFTDGVYRASLDWVGVVGGCVMAKSFGRGVKVGCEGGWWWFGFLWGD
ncbi:hypothetical protein HDV00_009651 [Rhizophlyctis rosea]|nr:hypothetical protein HDV00_009651 [Rhizophlyctis rosea]